MGTFVRDIKNIKQSEAKETRRERQILEQKIIDIERYINATIQNI